MGSKSGYVDLEVSASTIGGAKEQLQRIYGAEQIINLREISGGGGSSSGSNGLLDLVVFAGGMYLLLTFFPIPIAFGAFALYILYKVFS